MINGQTMEQTSFVLNVAVVITHWMVFARNVHTQMMLLLEILIADFVKAALNVDPPNHTFALNVIKDTSFSLIVRLVLKHLLIVQQIPKIIRL